MEIIKRIDEIVSLAKSNDKYGVIDNHKHIVVPFEFNRYVDDPKMIIFTKGVVPFFYDVEERRLYKDRFKNNPVDEKTNSHRNFAKDEAVAKKTEAQAVKVLTHYFESKGVTTKFDHFNKTSAYDIGMYVDGKQTTFEVKEDFKCEETGNVGLEYSSWNRPSGISVSMANYYLYKVHTPSKIIKWVLIKTSVLKKMIKDELYFRIVSGGDEGSNSLNYLFRLPVFLSGGKVIYIQD